MDRTSNERVVGVAGPSESSPINTLSLGLSWGAVIAGALASLAVWFLVHTLGIGIGLIVVDPEYSRSLRGVGIGTGIWSMLAPLVGLFVGGIISGRISGAVTRVSAVIHGVVLWALTIVASLLIMVNMMDAVVGGAENVVVGGRGETARITAEQAADQTGGIMLGMFFVMALGLASAILGAYLAEQRNTKRIARVTAAPYQAPTPRGAV